MFEVIVSNPDPKIIPGTSDTLCAAKMVVNKNSTTKKR
jgi:hypothetical protein